MKIKYTLAALGAALLTMPAIGVAAEAPEDKWQFGVTLPFWAPGIDGDYTVRGKGHDVDVSFDDLKENLDAAYGLALEARKDKFGLFTSFGYMKFGANENVGGARLNSDLKFIVADAGVSYRLLHTGGERPLIVEGYGGVRYWRTETDLKIKDSEGSVLVDKSGHQDLTDPIFGLRASQYLTPKLHLDFQGDIGGFGLGQHQADFEWSAGGMVSYDVAKWCTLSGGYKALALDKSEGNGNQENGVNIVMHGLALAAKFKF